MKKLLSLLVLFCLFSTSVLAAETAMNIVLQSYEPYPAEPGSYITAKFRATNVGNSAASDYIVQFQPAYPFSLDPSETGVKSFGTVNPNSDVVFEYKLRVDEKAVIGDNELTFQHSVDGGKTWFKKDFNILIKLTEAVLFVSDVTASPEQFNPGEKGSLDITLENLATTSLKDVTVKLGLETETSATTGTTIRDLPFAPLYSTTEKKVRFLEGESTETFSFDLMTYSNAESRLYKVPMTISYTDESGNTYSKTDLVGVIVGSKPKLSTIIESSEIRSASGSGEVVLKFINKGVTNIKFLNVMIEENDVVDVLSTTNEVYLGNLDSDDYDTAAFRLQISGNSEAISLPVIVEYMDANNKEYREELLLEMPILSAGELGIEEKSPVGTIVFVVIVLAVIAFLIMRRKKKKQRRKE